MQIAVLNIARNLPLFAGLSEQEKEHLIQAGRMHRYAAGQRLFLYGDEVQHFYVICDGAVQLFRETPDGHEMTAVVLISGDTVGEVDILQSHPTHEVNAVAVKDTVALEISIGWFKENVKRNNLLTLNLSAILSRRLQAATIESEHKSTMTAAQQVACFLKRLCVLHDFDPHGFDLPYSKTLIASCLGMELETFSRVLTNIRDHGIAVRGKHVSFADLRDTESYACNNCSIAGNCYTHNTLREKLLAGKPTQAARA
jgi:CRP/FNR family transcriptional regulator, dissimilatory nitrate respiration regulator